MYMYCLLQATVICDLMVMYVVKRRKYYKENKYQLVEDEEALVRQLVILLDILIDYCALTKAWQ
jgi:hypothetical protein